MIFGSDISSKLTVAISTTENRVFNSKIQKILKPYDGLEYLLIVQVENDISDRLNLFFKDFGGILKIVVVKDNGVAKSRNLAIDNCSTRYLWFCDDDLDVFHEEILKIEGDFRKYQKCSFLCFPSLSRNFKNRKQFADHEHKITLFNSGKYATFELAIDVARIKEKFIKFDTKFGAGTKLYYGDEFIFISDCLKNDLFGYFIPRALCVHENPSSGFYDRINKNLVLSKIFQRVFGFWWFIIYVAFYLKKIFTKRTDINS